MSTLPVSGYTQRPPEKVALVNGFKQDEERLLRKLEGLANLLREDGTQIHIDPRWVAIARTQFEKAFMALNRAVFQPQRIKLPEDGE